MQGSPTISNFTVLEHSFRIPYKRASLDYWSIKGNLREREEPKQGTPSHTCGSLSLIISKVEWPGNHYSISELSWGHFVSPNKVIILKGTQQINGS